MDGACGFTGKAEPVCGDAGDCPAPDLAVLGGVGLDCALVTTGVVSALAGRGPTSGMTEPKTDKQKRPTDRTLRGIIQYSRTTVMIPRNLGCRQAKTARTPPKTKPPRV